MLGRPQGTHCKSGCGLTPWYLKHENYYYYYYYYIIIILLEPSHVCSIGEHDYYFCIYYVLLLVTKHQTMMRVIMHEGLNPMLFHSFISNIYLYSTPSRICFKRGFERQALPTWANKHWSQFALWLSDHWLPCQTGTAARLHAVSWQHWRTLPLRLHDRPT